MTAEYPKLTYVYGPPGCGKTTYIKKQVAKACANVGPERVMAVSFSKAGAKELAGRGLGVPKENVSTISARAYRLLGAPVLAESKVDIFNESRHLDDRLIETASGKQSSLTDDYGTITARTTADGLFSSAQTSRHLMDDPSKWENKAFYWFRDQWMKFKEENDFVDFTDLIEKAAVFSSVDLPNKPLVMFVDEAQDNSPLEMKLIRNWGMGMQHVVIVGDPDQSIYAFKGAAPETFIDPTAPNRTADVILGTSYRLPEKPRKFALRWIERIPDREPIVYDSLPDAEEGGVFTDGGSFLNPAGFVRKSQEHAQDYLDENVPPGRERIPVMVLATCSYMLKETLAQFRRTGVKFYNPYRLERRDWNPLGSLEKGITSTERLLAMARPDFGVWGKKSRFWTWADLKKWTMPLGKDAFKKGAKAHMNKLIERALDSEKGELPPLEPRHVKAWIQDAETYDRIMAADYKFYVSLCQKSRQDAFKYPVAVADKNGSMAALVSPPLIVVGTIHSVKGGEADHVLLFPDLSRTAHEAALKDRAQLQESTRLFYVGITRCSKSIRISSPGGPYAMISLKRLAMEIMLDGET